METKLFEIRDEGTHIDAIAIQITPEDARQPTRDGYLIRHAGYTTDPQGGSCVLLSYLCGRKPLTYDPFDWSGNRTMLQAHYYIEHHWDELKSGDLICVETLLGLRDTPKQSDEMEYPIGVRS